jgi:membrane-associated phospholipid phosphatase
MKLKIREGYNKSIGKWIPDFGLLPLISCFAVNGLVYWGSQILMNNKKHYDFTSWLDNQVPFVKEWVIIYVVCYLFWAINYILVSREGREHCYRFVFADILSRLICGIFFLVLPTTNIRPTVTGNGLTSWLMSFIYAIDTPTNLFPSIHCLVSWFCFIGIRGSKKIPLWYKVFSCIFAILVFASTQFTKQHYLIDIAGGIIIAEICYYIAVHTQIYLGVKKIFVWAEQRLFGEICNDE